MHKSFFASVLFSILTISFVALPAVSANATGSGSTVTTSTTKSSTVATSKKTTIFTDTESHWSASYDAWLSSNCNVEGLKDGSGNILNKFAPDQAITRAELVKMLVGCSFSDSDLAAPSKPPFPDVSTKNWSAPSVAKAKELGIVTGYADGTFRGGQTVSRAEMVAMILRAKNQDVESTTTVASGFSDVRQADWYSKYVNFAAAQGLLSGYKDGQGNTLGTVGPNDPASRGQAAKVIAVAAARFEHSESATTLITQEETYYSNVTENTTTTVMNPAAQPSPTSNPTPIPTITPTPSSTPSPTNIPVPGILGIPTLVTTTPAQSQYIAAANGGVVDASKATFNFFSSGASSTISELKFRIYSNAGTEPVASLRIGNVSAQPVDGFVDFTGLNLQVPNGGSGLNQDVFVSYSEVGINGEASGNSASIILTYMKYTSGGTTTDMSLGGSISTPYMVLVGSKPVLSVSKPNATLAVGSIEAIDVTVAADAKGNITLNTLPITVSASAATATLSKTANSIVVKDSNNTVVATTNTAFDYPQGGTTVITFTGGYMIQAGQSQTFKIFVPVAMVTGTGASSASLSSSLATLHFSWTDTAGFGTVPMTRTDYIPNYPSAFTSVIYN